MTVEDRVVWAGEPSEDLPVGSSGKLRAIDGDRLFVDWGGGYEGWYSKDEVVSCEEAARRGIQPWATSLGSYDPEPSEPERLKRPTTVRSPEFARMAKLSSEHPCPACRGIRKPCATCHGSRVDPAIAVWDERSASE